MILLYRGKSWVSRLIEAFNWSKYSHASWTFATIENGFLSGLMTEWESWPSKGVQAVNPVGKNHSAGTRIDLYDLVKPLSRDEEKAMQIFLDSQKGKGYDWRGVFHFLTREKTDDASKWFCSEYVFAALCACGRKILENIPCYQVYPGMLSYSPEVRYVGYIVCKEGFRVYP